MENDNSQRKEAFEEIINILFNTNDIAFNAWMVTQKYKKEFGVKKV